MDECTVRSDDSSKELKEQVEKSTVDLKSLNDDEFKDVNDDLQNGLNKAIEETESQLNDLSLNDKSKRVCEDDASEDEYYDVTSDGSNVDSETSSIADVEEDRPVVIEKLINDDEQIDNEEKVNKSADEREQGDGEVSYMIFIFLRIISFNTCIF